LEQVELVPFRALVAEAPVVMVAHLACPQLGDGELPATLAPRITTDLLRGDLGFTGVAVTDAMDMQGVAGHYGVEEAAVRALAAGCDLLLYCFEIDKPQRARAAVLEALESGRLPRARVEEAAARVERLQALAAAAGERAALAPPPGPLADDAARYKELCGRALHVLDPQAWRAFARVARERGGMAIVGWPPEVLERLAARVRQHGLDPAVYDAMAFEQIAAETPVLVVLGERRPLAPERVACLRRLALERSPVALANLLTPEIDTPLVESFTTLLRSADHSDAMLEVVAARIADRDGSA
jgi:beta-N-acetylhexosaminidase